MTTTSVFTQRVMASSQEKLGSTPSYALTPRLAAGLGILG